MGRTGTPLCHKKSDFTPSSMQDPALRKLIHLKGLKVRSHQLVVFLLVSLHHRDKV